MRRSLTLFTLASCIITATLSAQAVRLQYKDAEGTVRMYSGAYHVHCIVEIATRGTVTQDMTLTFTMREKVNFTRNDGSANITDEVLEGSISIKTGNNEKKDPLKYCLMTYDRTRAGKVSNMMMSGDGMEQLKAIQGGGENANLASIFGMSTPFPDRELATGETWKDSAVTQTKMGWKRYESEQMKLVGTKAVDNKRYLQISGDLTMNIPKHEDTKPDGVTVGVTATMKGKATTLFDDQTGAVYANYCQCKLTVKLTADSSRTNEGLYGSLVITITGNMKQIDTPSPAPAEGG